jgi:glycolate oxidase FAD binding subunit
LSAGEEIEQLAARVRNGNKLLPAGGGSKPALSAPGHDVSPLSIAGLSGIVEYDPAELTITVLAGTRIDTVQRVLTEQAQHLPFDPPRVSAGATVGGVVATGAAGPLALRHGGVRDFVIGVRIIDGAGRLIKGGGKVVKNAAGFDLPKLMVGSMGRLGAITEVSFKVFPKPESSVTLRFGPRPIDGICATISSLCRGPLALDAIDIFPDSSMSVRISGDSGGLEARAARLRDAVGGNHCDLLDDDEAETYWRDPSAKGSDDGDLMFRVPVTLTTLPGLDAAARELGIRPRHSLAGNVTWLAWPDSEPVSQLSGALSRLGLTAQGFDGPAGNRILGRQKSNAFADRVASAIDPNLVFQKEVGP